jgi:hypothetical protein
MPNFEFPPTSQTMHNTNGMNGNDREFGVQSPNVKTHDIKQYPKKKNTPVRARSFFNLKKTFE